MTSKAKKILPGEEKILPGKRVARTKKVADKGAERPSPASSPAGAGLTLAQPASPEAERPGGASKAKEFRSMKPDRSQAAACRSCGWIGVLGDCAERGMGGDAFSEGWAWHCPHCKAVVEVYAWRQLELIATSS